MAKVPKIHVGALNISADPHPKGIYRQLFDAAAEQPVRLRGSDWAKITKPLDREGDRPSFYGRILVWTEIDRTGPWLKQSENREATTAEKSRINLPEDLDPNYRSFNFVFLEDTHVLVVEYKNEAGHNFSAKTAKMFFGRLFEEQRLKEHIQVNVTIEPSQEALEKIYAIKRLTLFEVYVVRPNPDDLGDETERVLDRLKLLGAKDQLVVLHKKAGDETLTPEADGDLRVLAEVAARNGYVRGKGTDENGTPVEESTAEHPRVVIVDIEGPSSIGAFFHALRNF